MGSSKLLGVARKANQDEFYTQLSDIEEEMRYYREQFRGKVVLCNCDDPRESNFFRYFVNQFESLGLKKLITIGYGGNGGRGVLFEYSGGDVPSPGEINVRELEGDGDFRSPECIEYLKAADIVVTNPPFSLFRAYIAQLMEFDKGFIILGNMNAVTYKVVFPLFRDGKVWYGPSLHSGGIWFRIPDHYIVRTSNYKEDSEGNRYVKLDCIRWFTNLDHEKRHKELALVKSYAKEPERYPRYDNYDAINVDRYKDIPGDYYGVMGVPITIFDHYSPDQFEILAKAGRGEFPGLKTKTYGPNDYPNYSDLNAGPTIWVDGKLKNTYARILIRRRKNH